MTKFEHNLRRFIATQYVDKIESLQQQIADPTNFADVQFQIICALTGIPKRILFGSERGELASSQDKESFNEVISSNEGRINNSGTINISQNTIKQDEIQIKVSKNTPTGQSEILAPGDIDTSGVEGGTIKNISKNALPILAYYDIFKNYYANTQEENFYIIGNTEELTTTIHGKQVNPNVIPSSEGRVNNGGIITISPKTIKQDEIQIKEKKYTNRTK